jgi:hypothetical protein
MNPHDTFIYAMLGILSTAVTKLWFDNLRLNKTLNELMKHLGISEGIVHQVGECSVDNCYLRRHAKEAIRTIDRSRAASNRFAS